MKRSLFALSILIVTISNGQELKKVKKNGETYYVLASNPSIRHGEYKKSWVYGLEQKGQYVQGKKSGIWEFYSVEGDVIQKYDYTDSTLIENKDFASIYTKAIIAKSKDEQEPSQPPILIGGSSRYFQFQIENMRYPNSARAKGTEGTVVVSAVVNAQGNLTNIKISQGLRDGCNEEALRTINLYKSSWIPGRHENKNVDVLIFIQLIFRLN